MTDLLERARAIAACPLFEDLAPVAVMRLAERARTAIIEPGERRTTADTIWIVARGTLAVCEHEVGARREAGEGQGRASAHRGDATDSRHVTEGHRAIAAASNVLGLVRVVHGTTAPVEAVALEACELVGVAVDDMRDLLEEDPAALAALADRLAALLSGPPP